MRESWTSSWEKIAKSEHFEIYVCNFVVGRRSLWCAEVDNNGLTVLPLHLNVNTTVFSSAQPSSPPPTFPKYHQFSVLAAACWHTDYSSHYTQLLLTIIQIWNNNIYLNLGMRQGSFAAHGKILVVVLCAVRRDSFYVRQSSQHRQSSCSVHCTAALPVLAGLVDVERVTTHSTTARILPCAINLYCDCVKVSIHY